MHRPRKSERGGTVLAPCTYRPKTSTATTASTSGQAQVERGPEVTAPVADSRQLRDCRVVCLFDVAQTEGEPPPDVAPALLTGQAPVGLPATWPPRSPAVTHANRALLT